MVLIYTIDLGQLSVRVTQNCQIMNCALMEIEPKEENPWLSQVEIWNKKLEDQKWREEEELLELEQQQREQQQEKEREKEERAKKKLKQQEEEGRMMIERVGNWNSLDSLFTQGFGNGSKVPPIQVQYFINNNLLPIASAAEESPFRLQKKRISKILPVKEDDEMEDASVVTELHQSNQISLPSQPSLLPPRSSQSNHYHPSKWTLSFLFYACFLFISIFSLVLLSWHFLTSLHKDISIKLSNQYALLNQHIHQCAHDWQINGCGTVAKSIPHMSTICKEWQECMHQDPENIDRYFFSFSFFSRDVTF